MMDDRMGSMGSTQGVNDNSTPISAKAPITVHQEPPCSTRWMPWLSLLSVLRPPAVAAA